MKVVRLNLETKLITSLAAANGETENLQPTLNLPRRNQRRKKTGCTSKNDGSRETKEQLRLTCLVHQSRLARNSNGGQIGQFRSGKGCKVHKRLSQVDKKDASVSAFLEQRSDANKRSSSCTLSVPLAVRSRNSARSSKDELGEPSLDVESNLSQSHH